MKRCKKKSKKAKTVAKRIVEGLEDFAASLKSGIDIKSKYRYTTVVVKNKT